MKSISKMRIGKSQWRASSLNATHFRNGDDCDPAAVISATPEENNRGFRDACGGSNLCRDRSLPLASAIADPRFEKSNLRITFLPRAISFPNLMFAAQRPPRLRRVSTPSVESKVIGWKQ
jgi:hypothetical protein